ncbi:hypothetical protein GY45DRAFT_1279178 [Cubamyces sp. BRFM 1775]|nr:hypothetical protein GY45DRAFT_1279178 [Cubamyces sp. BRFM 1775]
MPCTSTEDDIANAVARSRRAALAREMHWVTFSSVAEWLDTCIPGGDVPDTNAASLIPFKVTRGKGERVMYSDLCQGFNDILRLFQNEGFLMQITTEHPDTTASKLGTVEADDKNVAMWPDLAMYNKTAQIEKLYKAPIRKSKRGAAENEANAKAGKEAIAEGPAAHVANTVWAHAEFIVHAEHNHDFTPFSFDPGEEEECDAFSQAADREDARGHLIAYAREICARQHRRYVYLISVYRDFARFIRVDRTAALLSAPFNYVHDPMLFATFIYRYINATPEKRGHDPTATSATKEECQLFSDAIAKHSAGSHLYTGLQNTVKDGWPIFKLSIWGRWSSDDGPVRADSPEETREFLVGRPAYRSQSMTGRDTRGFFAYDAARDRIVFIKDYWRVALPGDLTEYDVYMKLSAGSSDTHKFFPTLLGGGDVRSRNSEGVQRTFSDKCAQLPVAGRIHVRLVTKEVCRRLQTFKDWRELVSVMRGALCAHEYAWEEHGILHRDLSVGNILIYDVPDGSPEPKTVGVLSDWDLAKQRDQIFNPVASQSTRSGTWQFMSAALSRFPEKPHLLSDDLESSMHVLNWLALKHMHTDYTESGASETAHRIRELYDVQTSAGLGSGAKWESVTQGARAFGHDHPPDHPFITLLDRLSSICAQHYQAQRPKVVIVAAQNGTLAQLCSGTRTEDIHGVQGSTSSLSTFGNTEAPLNNHTVFINAFDNVLQQKTWPVLEKLVDQVPDQEPTSSSIGGKRLATDGPESEVKGKGQVSC